MPTEKFQCPECGGRLQRQIPDRLACTVCAETIMVHDGIADFVRGRFDTILDAGSYDGDHGIREDSSAAYYDNIRAVADWRWPDTLGSVVEIGCGTGLFSRALVERGEATDMLFTDISTPMLKSCRAMLARLPAVSPAPISFATYSSHENCFRDVAFDTCVGASALHHIPDVSRFLADIFRGLKPGGRMFFIEPNQRADRALGQALSDVMAILSHRDPAWSDDRQKILNVLAESRRRLLHQGDIEFLSDIEDKHMFLAEEFEDLALSLGFDTAEALPFAPDPTGARTIRNLCRKIGVSGPFVEEIADLLNSVGSRYFDLLSPRDTAPSFLLWATKRAGPVARSFHAPPHLPDTAEDAHSFVLVGGIAPRWSFDLRAYRTQAGIVLKLNGWCIAHVDIAWIRIVLDGVARQAPVWLPRPDVHAIIDHAGFRAAWGALCCGVQSDLEYPDRQPSLNKVTLSVEIVLRDGGVIGVTTPEHLCLEETVVLSG
jgi:ubiquinone/menaquinone biosynthesis C-methylase UbiE